MARRKVIITVAQTGAFHGKEANPNIPLTPEEIAASAYDCYNAGAAIIHIHARDQEGLSTNDPKVYSAIGSGIRARCNAILQYSTAPANREGTCAEDGMRLLYDPDLVKPEMCSLDCSLIGTSWGDRTFVYEWYRPFLLKYARKMRDMGIKPELECFNPESVEDVFNVLVPAGVLEEPVSLSFVMGMDRISQGSISFSEENLDFMIKKLPKDRFVNFSTISIGAKHHVPGMAMTVLKGGGARVGMEDNIYYAPGELLKSNAQMVERAVRIIRELGMEVATPDEAREILKLGRKPNLTERKRRMEKQKFYMPASLLIKILVCLAVIAAFWVAPPVAPLTAVGMRVIGIFIGVILMLSIVDTVWPAMLAIVLLGQSGVCTVNEAIAGSIGNWIIYFVLMSFIMTHALNESGFTDRLVAKFMSIKLVSKSPWIFTISLGVLGMLLGCFMDQVPATAFMLAFVSRIYKELGYTSRDAYPHVANILTVFGVNIGGAMTPISHSLAILGIGIYEGATGESLSLFSYLAFGVPTGLILFVLLCVAVRLLTRPDMSKFKDFKIENVVKKQGPMTLREGTTAVVFFVTVIMWILPGVLKMFSDTAWVNAFNSFGITFWAILSVVVMAVIHIDGRPLLDVRTVVNQSINWGILIFISIGVYLGSAMSADSTGIVAAIQQNITPLTQSVAPVVVVFVIATVSVLMTNFASNVSTITVMTAVGVALAASSGGAISAVGIALVTTMCGSCAYLLPSSFATIAMLHGHEYSSRNQIYLFGIIMIVITSLIIGFVGYPIGCALTGS